MNKDVSVLDICQSKVHPSGISQSICQFLLLLRSLMHVVQYQDGMSMIWRVGKILSSIPKIICPLAVDKPCDNWARLPVIFLFSGSVNRMEFNIVYTLHFDCGHDPT